MRLFLAGILLAVLTALPARAAELIRVESPYSVAKTTDRLAAAVEAAGAKVFARVPHSKGAASIGTEIPDNMLLIFGDPKMGTPVIDAAPTAGLDLPLRVVIFDDGGQTVMVYRDPASLSTDHGLPADHPTIAAMTGALAKLTAKAAE